MFRSLTIRESKPSDVDGLYQMGTDEEGFELSPKTRFYQKEYLLKWLENSKDDILTVAEKDGDIVGFLFCRIFHKTYAMLYNIIVNSTFREQGIGSELLNECLRKPKAIGVKYVSGIVKARNESKNFSFKNDFLEGNSLVWIKKIL